MKLEEFSPLPHSTHFCCPSGVNSHQPHHPARLREQKEGLHHWGGRPVVGLLLPHQEGLFSEQQQSRCAAETPAGCCVWAPEPLMHKLQPMRTVTTRELSRGILDNCSLAWTLWPGWITRAGRTNHKWSPFSLFLFMLLKKMWGICMICNTTMERWSWFFFIIEWLNES